MTDRRASLVAEVAELAGWFRAAGHRIFLVGGVVRDLELGIDRGAETDIDLTTDAVPAETKAVLAGRVDALWTQGEKFGTIGCQIRGREFEITTHRAEAYERDSRKPVVEFSTAIEADLSRRDFTVNAMAIELPEGDLIDPFDGAGDLEAKRLRTPLSPQVAFSDDPLRMLRAARFATTYDLAPDPEVVAAMTAMADRLTIVSRERIRDEIDKMLRAGVGTAGLDLMAETGLLQQFAPEIDATARARLRPAARVVKLAALLWDDDALFRLRELKYSGEDIAAVQHATAGARAVEAANDFDPPTLRRVLTIVDGDLGPALELAAMVGIDTASFEAAMTELAKTESYNDLTPALSGGQIMKLLGLDPGPKVGEALKALRELRIQEGPMSPDREREFLLRFSGNA